MTERKELPDYYLNLGPTVSQEAAKSIIEAVRSTKRSKKELRCPDADQLVVDVARLQDEYLFRKAIDSILLLSELESRYAALKDAANELQRALTEVTRSWSAHYFLINAQAEQSARLFEIEDKAAAVIRRMVRRSTVALAAVKIARGSDDSQRWYELAEGDANAWLWERGIPDLFWKCFGRRFTVHGSKANPGARFVTALCAKAGLPLSPQETLKGRLKRMKAREERGVKAAAISPRSTPDPG